MDGLPRASGLPGCGRSKKRPLPPPAPVVPEFWVYLSSTPAPSSLAVEAAWATTTSWTGSDLASLYMVP